MVRIFCICEVGTIGTYACGGQGSKTRFSSDADCSLKQEGIIVRCSIEVLAFRRWVVHEVETDRSLNVNNGDTSSVDKTLPP